MKRKSEETVEVNSKRTIKIASYRNYSDASPVPDIMNWSREERINFINNSRNPYGYPEEYYQIYEREKKLVNVSGHEGLLKVNDVKIFNHRGEQKNTLIKIQQVLNTNCIKGVVEDYFDDEEVLFPKSFKDEYRNETGFMFFDDYDEFIEYIFNNGKVDNESLVYMFNIIKETNININSLKSSLKKLNGKARNLKGEKMQKFIDEKQRIKDQIEHLEDQFEDLEDKFYESCSILKDQYESIKSQTPNKYKMIHFYLKKHFGEHSRFIELSGGFALSKYIYENYGYSLAFKDLDIFIHGCDEQTANEICFKFKTLTGNKIYENDNVLFSHFYTQNKDEDEDKISFNKLKSVQIIKRLYTCPSQIIHGFDVDCCCITTSLDGDIYITERGHYALKHGYNVLNFDKMSPSYEYRLYKYSRRGIGIWIPFSDHFKENAVFDFKFTDKDKLSSIIIRKLINKENTQMTLKNLNSMSENNDSFYSNDLLLYNDTYVTFKTINPGEQIVNTFHRIVLNDPKEWYPVRNPLVIDKIDINSKNMSIVEILNPSYDSYSSMNILKTYQVKYRSQKIMDFSHKLVNFIVSKYPDITITGELIVSCINGINHSDVKMYSPSIKTLEECNILKYQIMNFKINHHMFNHFMNNKFLKVNGITLPEQFNMFNIGNYNFKIYQEYEDEEDEEDEEDFSELTNFNFFKGIDFNDSNLILKISSYNHKSCFMYSEDFLRFFESVLNYNTLNNYVSKSSDSILFTCLDNYKYYITQEDALSIFNYTYPPYNDNDFLKFDKNVRQDVYNRKCRNIMYSEIFADKLNNETFTDTEINKIRKSLMYMHIYDFRPNLNIDIVSSMGDNFNDEVTYNNGRFFSTDYNYGIIKLGINERQLNNGSIKIFDSPTYEQFFPVK